MSAIAKQRCLCIGTEQDVQKENIRHYDSNDATLALISLSMPPIRHGVS
ncbi:hypothetical protein [Vreelandella stevensii]